jgi:hypothetical protein
MRTQRLRSSFAALAIFASMPAISARAQETPDNFQMLANVEMHTCSHNSGHFFWEDKTAITVDPRADLVKMDQVSHDTLTGDPIRVKTQLQGRNLRQTYDGMEDDFSPDILEILSYLKRNLVGKCNDALQREAARLNDVRESIPASPHL